MFQVNGNPILADDMEVLQELRSQLAEEGIQRFAQFKVGSHNIQFNCPIHSGGQERKPSCGITTSTVGETPAGTVHCFSCGYVASLEKMISDCFGHSDDGSFGKAWLIKNFLTVSIGSRKDIDFMADSRRKNQADPLLQYISEEELDSYRYYHPYMYQRKLTNEVISKFDVGFDPNFKLDPESRNKIPCLTFPVRDLNGKTLFVARRAVDSKFFHYPREANKPVYGLYELPEDLDELIICESILNALTCYVYGKPAVALLGLGTDYQYEQLRNLKVRKLILALDADDAGDKGSERLLRALKGKKIITRYEIPKGMDINDLTFGMFHNLVEVF